MTEPLAETRRARLAAWGPALALVALVLLFFADPLFTGRVFFFRDVGLAVHPVLQEARTLPGGGFDPLPFWTNHLSNGKPLLANPGYALLHPFNLLYAALPFDLAFDLFVVLHVLVAALGMAWLARSEGGSRAASFAAGACFGLGGYVVSTTNLYPALATAAWTPLVVLAALRATRRPTAVSIALLSLALAVSALGGQPEPLALAIALGGAWSLLAAPGGGARRVVRVAATWGVAGILSLALAAPQVLPSALLARESVRSMGFTTEALLYNSVHPGRLPGLVIPRWGGHPMTRLVGGTQWDGVTDTGTPYYLSIYLGAGVVALGLAGLVLSRRPRGRAPSEPVPSPPPAGLARAASLLATAAAAGVVLASGRHLPGAEWLVDRVPLLVPFRYPEKVVFLAAFAAPLLGALGLDELARRAPPALRRVPWLIAGLVVADLAIAHRDHVPAILSSALSQRPVLARQLGELAREAGAAEGQWRVHHQRLRKAWRAPLPRDKRTEVALYQWQRSLLVPATALPQGVRYAWERTGDQLDLLPYFKRGIALHEAGIADLARGLGRAGVLFVVSPDGRIDVESEGVLARVTPLGVPAGALPGSGFLLRNTAFLPRARLDGDVGTARIEAEDHRSLVVRTESRAPARLVVSDVMAPGWTARVDGVVAPIELVDGAFRGVGVPAGEHEVRFDYVPPGLVAGAWCAAAAAAILLAAIGAGLLRRSRRGSIRA